MQYKWLRWTETQKQDGKMLTKYWTGNYHKRGWIKIQKALCTQVGRQGEEAEAPKPTTLTCWFLKGPAHKWWIWQQKFVIKLLEELGRGGRVDNMSEVQQCSTNILDRKNCSKAIAHHLFDLEIFEINVCGSSYKKDKEEDGTNCNIYQSLRFPAFFTGRVIDFLSAGNVAGFTDLGCNKELDVCWSKLRGSPWPQKQMSTKSAGFMPRPKKKMKFLFCLLWRKNQEGI